MLPDTDPFRRGKAVTGEKGHGPHPERICLHTAECMNPPSRSEESIELGVLDAPRLADRDNT